MASLKSRIIIGLLRNRHIFKGRFKKETMKHNVESVLAFRENCEKGAARFGKLPRGVQIQQETINMVLSEWIMPDGAPNHKLIFYVHGGGYVSGSCADHRNIVAKVALQTGYTALLYEYGLAPENPFPEAINDSLNVYKTVLEKGYKAENIIIMGESAGGGLCLALLLALRNSKTSLPKAAVAIQPWTDLSCSGPSYHSKNKVSMAPYNCWNVFGNFYIGNNDAKNPYISPLFGDLSGLPPIYINVGENDELYDDSISFYHKALQAGTKITLYKGKGMIHCYPLLSPMFREASEAMNDIVKFIKENLK